MVNALHLRSTLSLVLGFLLASMAMAQTKNLYLSPLSQNKYDIYKSLQTYPQKEFNGEKRFALVIGVSEYQYVSRLPNCFDDAKAMTDKLLEAGFDVMLVNDSPNLSLMRSLVKDAERYYTENNYNIALVYYSGHGVQLGELNWLVPKDLPFIDWPNISQAQAISLLSKNCLRYGELIQPFVRLSATRQVIGILDACRSYDYMAAGAKSITNEFATLLNNESQIMGDDKLSRIFSSKAGKISIAKHPESNYSYFTHYLLKCFNASQPSPCTMVDLKRELNKFMAETNQNSLIYPAPGSYEFQFYKCGIPSPSPSPQPANAQLTGTVTDIDGNTYKTVKIGDQWWMAENLRVTKFNDGTDLSGGYRQPSYYSYDGKSSSDKTFGKLYNFYVVKSSRNICPIGWHVPNGDEWGILLRNDETSLKSDRIWREWVTKWGSVQKKGNNSTGFDGLPGGYRNTKGEYKEMGLVGVWWNSSLGAWVGDNYDPGMINFVPLGYTSDGMFDWMAEESGVSIRCVKDN